MQSPVDGALPVGERIATLDILRGFALLGILIMNMPGFSNSFFVEADGSHLWPGRIDQLAENGRDMLFSGKFNSMFSLLFGIGFTIQFARMEQRDPARATLLYLRRLAVLAVLGPYPRHAYSGRATCCISTRCSGCCWYFPAAGECATIVMLIVLCLLYPVVSGALRLMVTTPGDHGDAGQQGAGLRGQQQRRLRPRHLHEAAAEHMREFAYFYGSLVVALGTLGFCVQMSLTMLLGLLAGRQRWVQRIPELMPQVRRLMWVALAVGLGCGAAFTLDIPVQSRARARRRSSCFGSLCYWTSRLAMMIFYVLTIVRLAQLPVWQKRLAPFAARGTHAAHQLPHANGNLHHTLLRLGFRPVGQSGSRGGAGARGDDLRRDPGPLEPLVAETPRAGAAGSAVGAAHLWPAGSEAAGRNVLTCGRDAPTLPHGCRPGATSSPATPRSARSAIAFVSPSKITAWAGASAIPIVMAVPPTRSARVWSATWHTPAAM